MEYTTQLFHPFPIDSFSFFKSFFFIKNGEMIGKIENCDFFSYQGYCSNYFRVTCKCREKIL